MSAAISRIAWFLPPLTKGSGGLNTIFRNAEALVNHGYYCDFFFPPSAGLVSTEKEVRKNMADWFDYRHDCRISLFETKLEDYYDMAIATFWDTAAIVADQSCKSKAYFIQDWEPSFYPVSDAYFLARQSYELGLAPITIGRWLAKKASTISGSDAFYTDFCADLSIYNNQNAEKENAICAIYQPEKPRRNAATLLSALQIVKKKNPELKVYLYGSNTDIEILGFTNLGIITKSECNDLYNRCKLGVSMSTTNPSRIPFEMMAAGLPVVELAGENTSFDLFEDAVCFAKPSPASLATTISSLLAQPNRLTSMSRAGISYMQSRPLSLERNQFVKACKSIMQEMEPSFFEMQASPQVILPDSDDALMIYRDIRREEMRYEAHLYKPKAVRKDSCIEFSDINIKFREIRVAIWSKEDQSDLQWHFMHRTSSEYKWSVEISFEALSDKPTRYFIHVYGIELSSAEETAPKLITPLEVCLVTSVNTDPKVAMVTIRPGITVVITPNTRTGMDMEKTDFVQEKAEQPCHRTSIKGFIARLFNPDAS